MPDSSDRPLRDDIHLLGNLHGKGLKAQEGQQLFQAALNQVAAGVIETEMRACVNSCMTGDADDRLGRVAKALATVLKSSWEYPSDAHGFVPGKVIRLFDRPRSHSLPDEERNHDHGQQ